ncbi:MAG: exosortase H [Candidatus Krumholzibacteriota bacterium]|nr:exosortase H [Candidatus Krumholzibacteriota bacterium]
MAAFFLLIHQDIIHRTFIEPYTNFVASTSRVALRVCGVDAGGSGELVTSPEFSVIIRSGCNGVEATAILFAVILSFPARWKSKLIGLGVGYVAIYFVNLGRIVILFFLGFEHPEIFHNVHYYYAQAFVILATLAIWLLWVSLYTDYGAKNRQAAAH